MKVTYLAAADSEFEEATAYYNKERADLGFEFADEVKQTLERIKNYPEAWTPSQSEHGVVRFIVFLTV
jgi:hypothetical protein